MSQLQTFFVTTPIYYVNDRPHIGHVYTTVAADVMARFNRLDGKEVFFLTGSDEHGQKVERSAEARGIAPIALADEVVAEYASLWERFEISFDRFIRTTEPGHKEAVKAIFQRLTASGTLYKGSYEDWYCTPCESFWTETQIRNGLCPDCARPVERLAEESYFFALSRYTQPLIDHIESHPEFIGPESRRNEVLAFLKNEEGLRDLSVSRTGFTWGIPVPGDDKHLIYVWIDALTNYLSALGYPDQEGSMGRFWPPSLHLIGKDILRFHAIYWPAMLMAADLPLPKRLYAHGWWTVEGEKMSKSKGNVVRPDDLLAKYPPDVIRYFMLRDVPFGGDGDYSQASLDMRYTTELANDLGNLAQRVLSMAVKQFGGIPSRSQAMENDEAALLATLLRSRDEVRAQIEVQAFHKALGAIWQVVGEANRFIDATAPWALAKQADQRGRLAGVLLSAMETIRGVAILLLPFMPTMAGKILQQMGEEIPDTRRGSCAGLDLLVGEPRLSQGKTLDKPVGVFPRLG
ncbi:MAG: methionine--tRNA ligase [Alphaproteobacteria bacterium CG_4_10_14_0_2_um_filter_63_37]|nr:MAG: methionine--tRNA ligase [Proteobacteria bacterium CG1_02_64_396]PJA25266.1 MAG: methionine--tRNA ligase [Alphaproteobacteria bacterium CG_4_10_14_0_2_um_filter_63_37]